MRRMLCLLLCCGLLLASAACGGEAPPEEKAPAENADADTVVFTDDLGREVALARPKRVAALIGSFADVWCLAGGEETLAAAANDSWTQFGLDLPETENLGSTTEPNVELLLAAEPDFVIGSTKTKADLELEELLERSGIPTAYFDVSSFADYLRMLEICTRLTGCGERYAQYGTAVQAQVDAAVSRQDGTAPRVLYVRATGASCKVKNSENTVLGEMLASLGCVNIADSETGLLEELSLETILREDPEHIFVVLQGADLARAEETLERALLGNPAWNTLTAVREGRCHYMDQRLYNVKPNARWGEAYEGLADILYPEQ